MGEAPDLKGLYLPDTSSLQDSHWPTTDCHDWVMSDWVPLLQTLVWAVLILLVLWIGRGNWKRIMTAVERRVSQGDDMTVGGPMGLSAQLKRASSGVPRLAPGDDETAEAEVRDGPPDSLNVQRRRMGETQRGVHLVHIVAPSEEPGQLYDVFAYLHGWNRARFDLPDDLRDVQRAEFYVGPLFNPSGVTVENQGGGRIGFVTAAHAPALCLCRVTFQDGHQVVLSRYLDFEAGELAERAVRR